MEVYRVVGTGREEHVQVVEQVQDQASRTIGRDKYVPENVEQVWVEEFGGGEWVKYPVPPKPVLPGASKVLASVLYGPGYQGPAGTRSTTGIWTDYPG